MIKIDELVEKMVQTLQPMHLIKDWQCSGFPFCFIVLNSEIVLCQVKTTYIQALLSDHKLKRLHCSDPEELFNI